MTPEEAAALRAPFPPEAIGKLPKAGIKLDYVGSRWSTRRGSEVPEWQRFMTKIRFGGPLAPDGTHCWQWQGALVSKGYGSFRPARSTGLTSISAHRWSWITCNGPIPDGLEIDHLCFNRACVNPDHMELVTRRENVLRGRRNQNDGKTHCIHGHPFDEANTLVLSSGKRQCRACTRENMRRFRAKASA